MCGLIRYHQAPYYLIDRPDAERLAQVAARARGAPCPVVGRVSMDMLTVDITAVPQARVGSPVVLWGEGLPVDDVATAAGTVGYELLCAVAPRVPFVVSAYGKLDLEL